MNKNLVLSAAIGYNFDQIKNFIISLRKYFSGEVHIIIDKNENKLEQEILKYDCKSIKTSVNKKRIQFKRYKIYLEFLKDKKFDNILLCDSRDIYFQNDPFKYDYKTISTSLKGCIDQSGNNLIGIPAIELSSQNLSETSNAYSAIFAGVSGNHRNRVWTQGAPRHSEGVYGKQQQRQWKSGSI